VVLGAVTVGLLFAVVLLGRQISDYLADARQPILRQNDVIGAAGSVAMIAFLGFVTYNTVRKAQP
jgi:hypothetical protein